MRNMTRHPNWGPNRRAQTRREPGFFSLNPLRVARVPLQLNTALPTLQVCLPDELGFFPPPFQKMAHVRSPFRHSFPWVGWWWLVIAPKSLGGSPSRSGVASPKPITTPSKIPCDSSSALIRTPFQRAFQQYPIFRPLTPSPGIRESKSHSRKT